MPGHYKKKKKDELKIAAGPALPKETSGGGYKGSGKPTKPKDVKLPGEKLAKKNTHKKGDPEKDYSKPLPGANPGWNIAKKKKKKKYTA